MPQVSAYELRFATEHGSNFQRAAREFLTRRPHLNPFSGSESSRHKKRDGERSISVADAISLLKVARQEGKRSGVASELVAELVNALLRDTLPDGVPLDVVARPVESEHLPVADRRGEELSFSVASAHLVTTIEEVVADGRIDLHEASRLELTAQRVTVQTHRLLAATRAEVKR
jgi:hypothetical protein